MHFTLPKSSSPIHTLLPPSHCRNLPLCNHRLATQRAAINSIITITLFFLLFAEKHAVPIYCVPRRRRSAVSARHCCEAVREDDVEVVQIWQAVSQVLQIDVPVVGSEFGVARGMCGHGGGLLAG
jgi:hypothetical protein